jgi:hypothetical protein
LAKGKRQEMEGKKERTQGRFRDYTRPFKESSKGI